MATKKNALKDADHIICSSKKTQNDLINYYDIDLNNTSVIYQGTPNIELTDKNLKVDYKFFYTLEVEKNTKILSYF